MTEPTRDVYELLNRVITEVGRTITPELRADIDAALVQRPEPEAYIIWFADVDRPAEHFSGYGATEAAYKRFEQVSVSWTCRLFVSPPNAAPPSAAALTMELERADAAGKRLVRENAEQAAEIERLKARFESEQNAHVEWMRQHAKEVEDAHKARLTAERALAEEAAAHAMTRKDRDSLRGIVQQNANALAGANAEIAELQERMMVLLALQLKRFEPETAPAPPAPAPAVPGHSKGEQDGREPSS
jgi:hypothetical protein